MAGSIFADVVKFTATAGSTANFAVSAAVTGYQTPAAAGAVTASQYSYRAESADLTQWEIGQGTYTSSNTTITRTPLFNSVGGSSAINFTVAPQVGFVALAEDLLPVVSVAPITNSLAADVALNNTSSYFDGPSVAQGTVGTWFASGTVTMVDPSITTYHVKLWDGTTVIASDAVSASAAFNASAALSGFLASPAGNLRISVRDTVNTTGNIKFNVTGSSRDSTITAFRIK
jgi:hypothetical protein